MAEVRLVVKQVDQGSDAIKGIGQRLDDLLGTAKNVTAGMVAMGATFKKAFDLSREGANLNQLRDSFELMNQEVFKTPGLLDNMSAAARGTIKEADLMAGLLKLTAGASDELAGKLAANAPQLLEIAKASNKLNPQLGDTAFLYDSIATGIKRASPLILDNLGIVVKVGEANEKYAQQLGKTVEALTAEEKQVALLNAVLESGDQLIQQVGGNVDSQADAWARLEVKVGESTDAFKQHLAEGLLPWVQLINGDFSKAIQDVEARNLAMAEATGDYTKAQTRTIEGEQKVMESIGRTAGSFEEYQQMLHAAGVHTFDIMTTRAWYDQAVALKQATGEAEQLNEQMDRMAQYNRDVAAAAEANSAENLAAAAAYEAAVAQGESYDRVLIQNYAHLQEAANAARNYSQAIAGQLQNLGGAGDAISQLLEAQQQLAGAQGEWVQTTRDNSGQIASINSQLAADLSDEQKGAMREILNTVNEGSAEWLAAYQALQGDLSDSQREALIAQRADLEASQGAVGSAYTGSIEDAEAAQEAIDAANQAIIDSYRDLAFEGALALAELSPDPDAVQRTLDYAVAIGELTQAEADMRLQAAEARIAIEELNQIVVDGGVSAEVAGIAFDLLASGTFRTAESAIAAAEKQQQLIDLFNATPQKVETAYTLMMGDSIERLREVKGLLDSVDGRHASASVTVNTSSASDLGSGSGDVKEHGKQSALGNFLLPGEMSQVGEFNQPELFKQNGRLFLIPGDQGNVIPSSQAGGMGGININAPLIGQVVQRPGESGQRFADRVSTMVVERIGSLK